MTSSKKLQSVAALLASCCLSGCIQNNVKLSSPHSTPLGDSPNQSAKKPEEAVQVVQKPLYLQQGAFVERQNIHSSRGLTDWYFHCYPHFDYDVTTNPLKPNQISLRIKKVTLTISCPVTVRIGKQEKSTIDHENGHVQIVKDIYQNAGSAAKEACLRVIGSQFDGTGTDRNEATADAIDQASRAVCKYYTGKTVAVVNAISANYDEITQHGNKKIPIPEAIKLATEKYRNKDGN